LAKQLVLAKKILELIGNPQPGSEDSFYRTEPALAKVKVA
jgi:hypothetical protein